MATRLETLSEPKLTESILPSSSTQAARAYDAVGRSYLDYADGPVDSLFEFTGRYSFADRQIWRRIDLALRALHAEGRRDIRILDAGCGPATWLIRAATHARSLGFRHVSACGFDISPEMIRLARGNSAFRGAFRFETADISEPFREATGAIDLVLCLYGVLNHVPRAFHEQIAAELARVTSGHLFVTVRTIGSLPTIYVDGIDKARHFAQDNSNDRFEVDLADGRHLAFTSHLFCAAELRALFAAHVPVTAMMGLDVFHSRFAAHPGWNPEQLPYADLFERELCRLEERCGSDPAFIDRAAHILLHADCTR